MPDGEDGVYTMVVHQHTSRTLWQAANSYACTTPSAPTIKKNDIDIKIYEDSIKRTGAGGGDGTSAMNACMISRVDVGTTYARAGDILTSTVAAAIYKVE